MLHFVLQKCYTVYLKTVLFCIKIYATNRLEFLHSTYRFYSKNIQIIDPISKERDGKFVLALVFLSTDEFRLVIYQFLTAELFTLSKKRICI